jgi:hypothetical protein
MSKKCIACGMPMEAASDFAQADATKDYCVHCARPDGTMRSYTEAVTGMAGFMVRTQGIDEAAARKAAIDLMSTLPAWKGMKRP